MLALLALISFQRGCETFFPQGPAPRLETIHEGAYAVVRVVDGDTIVVRPRRGSSSWSDDRGHGYVRLIGIDTPETVKPGSPVEPWGPEATEFTRAFLSSGEIELRLDRRRKDRYGRFLAYVYVEGEMLNEALVRAGLARADPYPGDSPQIAKRLHEAERAARRAKRGLWSD